MNIWKRKNEIIFFHNEPSIIDLFPIIESKKLKLDWTNKVRQDFQNRKNSERDMIPIHVSRCPGIFDLFKYGYVVPLHKDVLIRLKQGGGFEWKYITGDVEFGIEPFGVTGFKVNEGAGDDGFRFHANAFSPRGDNSLGGSTGPTVSRYDFIWAGCGPLWAS